MSRKTGWGLVETIIASAVICVVGAVGITALQVNSDTNPRSSEPEPARPEQLAPDLDRSGNLQRVKQTPAGKALQEVISRAGKRGEVSLHTSITITAPINMRGLDGFTLKNVHLRAEYTDPAARAWPVLDLVDSRRVLLENVWITIPRSAKVKPGCKVLLARRPKQPGGLAARSAQFNRLERCYLNGDTHVASVYNVGAEIDVLRDCWIQNDLGVCYYSSPYNDKAIVSPYGPFAGKTTFGGGTYKTDAISNVVHSLQNCHFGHNGNKCAVVIRSGLAASGFLNVSWCDFSIKGKDGFAAIYLGQPATGPRYELWPGTFIGNYAEYRPASKRERPVTADVVIACEFAEGPDRTNRDELYRLLELSPGLRHGVTYVAPEDPFLHP